MSDDINAVELLMVWDSIIEYVHEFKEYPCFVPSEGVADAREWVIENYYTLIVETMNWAGDRYGNDPMDLELIPEYIRYKVAQERGTVVDHDDGTLTLTLAGIPYIVETLPMDALEGVIVGPGLNHPIALGETPEELLVNAYQIIEGDRR